MSLTETKATIRLARQLMKYWTERLHAHRPLTSHNYPKGLNIGSRENWLAMEWGVAHLGKVWIPELDVEGLVIPGTHKLRRIHQGFMRNDGTENFLFRGLVVRNQDPEGFVFS